MIRGKTRFLGVGEDTPPSGLGIHASIHNKFELEVKDVTTGEVRQIGKAENIILDKYWAGSELYTGFSPGSIIVFGTGTGTISPDRTALFNQLGRRNIISSSRKVENNRVEKYTVFSGEIELLPAEYVGHEITEVGLFGTHAEGNYRKDSGLMTHALFKDANNNPISILKTSTDLITIKASVYLHYPNIDLKTTAIRYILASDSRVGWLNSILPVLRIALSSDSNVDSWSLGPGMTWYAGTPTVNGVSKKATHPLRRAETKDLNRAPITAFTRGDIYHHLITEELYSDITNEVVGLGDGIKTGFSTYFPFPINAIVKMDGVVVPDATVHQTYGTSFPIIDINSFMNRIYANGDLAPFTTGNLQSDRIFLANNSFNWPAGTSYYFKNRFPEQGISRLRGFDTRYEKFVSADLETWVSLGTAASFNIPEEYQNFEFFKFTALSSVTHFTSSIFFEIDRTDNIVFNTPPPEGAVIEVDYTFPGIAKDENHVLDMEMELSFGEREE